MSNYDAGLRGSELLAPTPAKSSETSQAMVPAQPAAVPALPMLGGGMPHGPEILHGPFNQTWLMNCLRRKWLAASLWSILAAGVTALALLWLFPLSSSVTALLEVSGHEEVSWDGNKEKLQFKELELFQETQMALIKSQFVLKNALSSTAISQLNAVRKETDPLHWLLEELRVNFKGEILEVRYDGEEDSVEMEKIINAVVHAYIQEVRETKRIESKEVVEKLADLHHELKKDLEQKIEDHSKLAKDLQGGDSPIASQILTMLGTDIRMIDQRIADAKKELIEIEVAKKLAEQRARSTSAVDAMVHEALDEDPIMQNYQAQTVAISEQLRAMTSVGRGNSAAQKRLRLQLQQLQQEIQGYEYQQSAALRKQLSNMPNEELRLVLVEYITRRDQLSTTLAELEAERAKKYEELQQRGEKSGMLAMLESEIEQLTEISRTMDYRVRSSDVQDETQRDSIRIMQPAYSEEKINQEQRYAIVGLGCLGSICATCYLVALVEFRKRRLNSAADVDEGLGIRVLGTLPPIASRKAMQAGSPLAVQLSESIDNVRATLMHDSASRGKQVVLITSPATMEGTTTVASHLALSFTRAGRRTLLIDGDLREPALHKLFGMPAEDGVCEVLRSELDIADAVRPTNTEGLWLLPAGVCDRDAVHALATDQLQPIFEKLRAEFEFIVIDAPPVLGLADTLSIGQHVDGVVLTVLRDQSEVRNISQAAELLRDLGIRIFGAVVNGVPVKADRRIARLHRNPAAKPQKLAAAATVKSSA